MDPSTSAPFVPAAVATVLLKRVIKWGSTTSESVFELDVIGVPHSASVLEATFARRPKTGQAANEAETGPGTVLQLWV